MQIYFRLDGSKAYECSSTDHVFALKQHIEHLHQIPVEEQAIYHSGSQLEDDSLLCEVLSAGDVVDVDVRLLGGKVHGSLARAGKVKGQTPKVEKQEKKKKATGRAKRRLQYNRRFVNAVRAPGRRRGPNANVQA